LDLWEIAFTDNQNQIKKNSLHLKSISDKHPQFKTLSMGMSGVTNSPIASGSGSEVE
jgi:uncharacterized pyridoxal phosphate-containing UPF0001 family protein